MITNLFPASVVYSLETDLDGRANLEVNYFRDKRKYMKEICDKTPSYFIQEFSIFNLQIKVAR